MVTPAPRSSRLSEYVGADVFVKGEHLQPSGSFKLRGAFNRLLCLSQQERRNGVVAASSGNHGAALALASEVLGIRARVFVPHGASVAKVEKIKSRGATVEFFGTDGLDTEHEARRVAAASGAVYVSPYNDLEVMAGQGTVALEMVEQVANLNRVYVAVGGGGLIGGMAAYLKLIAPRVHVIGVVPEHSPVMLASVREGRIVEMEVQPTLSDGTSGGIENGSVTFDACRFCVDEWASVREENIAAAMGLWWSEFSVPIEGAAGVAIAAVMRDRGVVKGERIGVVICGGNIAKERWESAVAWGADDGASL